MAVISIWLHWCKCTFSYQYANRTLIYLSPSYFIWGMEARRVVFEGCFQTLISNESKLTSKANNYYVQRGLFYSLSSIFQASSNKFWNRLQLCVGFTFCRVCLSRSATTNALTKLRQNNAHISLGSPDVGGQAVFNSSEGEVMLEDARLTTGSQWPPDNCYQFISRKSTVVLIAGSIDAGNNSSWLPATPFVWTSVASQNDCKCSEWEQLYKYTFSNRQGLVGCQQGTEKTF